jgi:hypothetical protein
VFLFTRAVARDFRMLFSRCVAGRPRGPAPPIVIQVKDGTRTVCSTTSGGVTLTHTTSAPKEGDDFVVLPAAVLADVEGGTDEDVTLDRASKLRGVVRWPGGGKPRSLPIELIMPGKQHELPASPEFSSVSVMLLTALHECGRSAARESGRYALSKVQLQGRAGRVVGTDGKIALVWNGVKFPFDDIVLVPAVPVFGAKPLAHIPDVQVGRTPTHLVVRVGPWSVWLPTDTSAKYPDVAGVVPRHTPSTAGIDERDAAELLRVLPGLPGGDHELRPVTIEADRIVRVRGRAESGETKEVTLIRSPAAGPAILVALDRRVLARALTLGCHTARLVPDRPVALEGNGFVLLAAQLDPVLIVPPAAEAVKTSTDDSPPVEHDPTNPERNPPMKPPETNGHTPPRGDPSDPLDLAEALRDALADAATKAARLVGVLRHTRKEKKALATVLTSLQQLNLGTGGPR